LVAIYISMIFAELASMYPTSGGIYDYCKHAYGKSTSFLIGWLTFLIGNITIAMLIIGAIQYLIGPEQRWVLIGLSAILIIFFNILSYRGMKTSVKLLVIFAFITLGTIIALIIPGILNFNPGHFTPFFTGTQFSILLAIFYISETFFGWESITFLAGEVKEGHKTVPKALVLGTIIIGIVSLIFVITSFGSIPVDLFGESAAPFSDLGRVHYEAIGGIIFTFLVFFSILGSVADWIVSSPRLIHTLSKDKLFLRKFSAVHPKYNTPHKAIVLQCIMATLMVFAAAGAYKKLLEMLVPLLLIMYSIVILALFILRLKKPDAKRYFKVPYGKFGSVLIVSFFVFLLVMWVRLADNALFILWECLLLVVIGYPIYFLMQMYFNPKAIIRSSHLVAYLALFSEKLFFPMAAREIILEKLGNVKGKKVLEYGSGIGSMTLHLSESVGENGFLYGVELTERENLIIANRLKKKDIKNTKVIHDAEMLFSVSKEVPKVQAIVSVNMLSNLQNVRSVLKDFNQKLENGDKIVFMENDRFFDVIRNVDWLSDENQIKNLFDETGFKIDVEKRQGNAWEYIFIYGVKVKNI